MLDGIDVVVKFYGFHACVRGNHLFIEVAQDAFDLGHRCGSLHLECDLSDKHVLDARHKRCHGAGNAGAEHLSQQAAIAYGQFAYSNIIAVFEIDIDDLGERGIAKLLAVS